MSTFDISCKITRELRRRQEAGTELADGLELTATATERVRLVMAFAKGRSTLRCCKMLACTLGCRRREVGDAGGASGHTHGGSGFLWK